MRRTPIDVAVSSNVIDCANHDYVRVVGGGTITTINGIKNGNKVLIICDGTSTTVTTSAVTMRNNFTLSTANIDSLEVQSHNGTLTQIGRNKNA